MTASRRPRKRTARGRAHGNHVGIGDPRLLSIGMVFALIGAFLIGVVIDLQTVRPDRYRSLGEDQRTRTRAVTAFRGTVTDRNGFVFAVSTPSMNLVADPMAIPDPAATANLLAPMLQVDSAALEQTLLPEHEGDKYTLVFDTVPEDAVAAIRAANDDPKTSHLLRGLVLRPQEDRLYPGGDLARPVVGRVNGDGAGRSGLERLFDELLTGEPGVERVERSGFGSISVGNRRVEPAAHGHDIELTLDHRLQFVAEQALANECQRLGAKGANAIITDVATGEILVMANVSRRDDGTCGVAGYNAAVMDSFEPGSVVKPLTVAAAVEEFGYDARTKLFVPDRIRISDKTFVDHPLHEAGRFSLSEIMAQSMNVGVIELATQLGPTRFHDYVTEFGIGSRTGTAVGGEAAGLLREPEQWRGSDAGSIVIGQGLSVTTLQLAAAYNALANHGNYLTPQLIRTTTDPDTADSRDAEPPRRVVSPETAAQVAEMMAAVIEDGTGNKAAIPGYRVAGKTGTAWKVFDDGSGRLSYGSAKNRRYVTTFAGFAPAERPRLSAVVVVDEPRTATSARTAAAPVWGEMVGYALRILEVPPSPSAGRTLALTKVRGTPAPPPEPEFDPRGVLDPAEPIIEIAASPTEPAPDVSALDVSAPEPGAATP